jgi:high-affinity Fe2+/Pb2+ permease
MKTRSPKRSAPRQRKNPRKRSIRNTLRAAGIGLICAGALAAALGVTFSLNSLGSKATGVIAAPEAFCSPGETLETITGQSVYTPGQGYAASVRYFCVTANGARREVTGAFAQTMFSDITSLLTSGGSLVVSVISGGCLIAVGILAAIASLFVRGHPRSEKPDDLWDAD